MINLVPPIKLVVDTKYPNVVLQIHPYVQKYIDSIIQLAEKCEVARLAVIGSAITWYFEPGRSDIDFVVSISKERYSDFSLGLYKILACTDVPYDLLDSSWISDEMLDEVERGVVLYEKSDIA